RVRGAMTKIGPLRINPAKWDWATVEDNPFWCPDSTAVGLWSKFLDMVRREGSSAGAIIEVHASGVPAGLGAPLYGKLDSDLAAAIMGINAVKAVEIGDGFDITGLPGEDAQDEMRMKAVEGKNEREVSFLSNHAGGILGGISTGQDIVVRFAVKPTSSILTPRRTVNVEGEDATVATKGRHDPCVGIRAVPVGEAMVACVLADHWLRHKAQCG
ncbi:MAG: chorismate synthase, partial [Rhodospirillaceae bacterium]|nr:chorismate synthase [Rhodospirillaceae bacterium]